jgi:hypothetical protein
MADAPFDRTVIHELEKPDAGDLNRAQAQLDRAIREVMRHLGEYRGGLQTSDAALQPAAVFFGDGFKVRPASPAAMQVRVMAGLGFLWAPAGNATDLSSTNPPHVVPSLDDLEGAKPLWLGDAKTISVPAADATNPRIDIVEVLYRRAVEDTESRDLFDVNVMDYTAELADKTLTFSLASVTPTVNGSGVINYKTGTPAGSPTEPTVTAGYVKIAAVRVQAASTTVPGTRITDRRLLMAAAAGLRVSVSALVNTSTWAFSAAPTITAPPGVVVGVQTYADYNGFSLPAIELLVYPGGALDDTTVSPAVSVTCHDGNFANAADASAPLAANLQTLVTTSPVSSGALGGGSVTAYWPNPSPEVPIHANCVQCVLMPLKWNPGSSDWTGVLPNPMRVSFELTLPVKG